MSFPLYPFYRESNIPWIGEIPSQWHVRRLKIIFQVMKREPRNEDEIITAFRDGEVTLRTKRRIDGFTNAAQEIGYQGIRAGDLVIHAMDAFAGAIGVSDSDGKSTPVYSVCRPRNANVSSYYYGRLLRHMALSGFINALAKGIRERSTEFRWSEAGDIEVPFPPFSEQLAIALFIGAETAKIDALIAEQERLIELLKEKRRSTIAHAVTRGLNPDAPMQDSGVEWLGEVPCAWGIKRLRHLTVILRGKFTHRPRNDPAFYDGEFPFIQTGDITGSSRYISEFKQTLNERGASVSKEFPKGTLVMAIAANIGDVAILNFPAFFPDSIVGLVPKGEVDLMFLYYLMMAMKAPLLKTATISTQMNLNVDQISSLIGPCPPVEEQKSIVAFLDHEATRLDALIAEAGAGIALLQERRSALISAAVTGKIDVRGLSAAQPEREVAA